MPKPTLNDRLGAPSPGVPLGRLILIILAVLVGTFVIGAILGKLFPPKPIQIPTTQSTTTRAATVPATRPTTAPTIRR